MRSALRPTQVATPARTGRPGERRAKVVVRRVDAWTVFRFSLLFYFCLMLIFVLGMLILYWIMGLTGGVDAMTEWFRTMWDPDFRINAFWLFSRLSVFGLLGVVMWSLVNTFVAVLYNLVSDVVGGISVTLAERR